MKKFFGFKAKVYSYLKHSNVEDKKYKGTKSCLRKRKLKLEYFKNCLEAAQLEDKINH